MAELSFANRGTHVLLTNTVIAHRYKHDSAWSYLIWVARTSATIFGCRYGWRLFEFTSSATRRCNGAFARTCPIRLCSACVWARACSALLGAPDTGCSATRLPFLACHKPGTLVLANNNNNQILKSFLHFTAYKFKILHNNNQNSFYILPLKNLKFILAS